MKDAKVMRGEGVKNSKGECAVNSNSQEAVMRPRKVFFFSNEKERKLCKNRKMKRKRER